MSRCRKRFDNMKRNKETMMTIYINQVTECLTISLIFTMFSVLQSTRAIRDRGNRVRNERFYEDTWRR